MATVSHLDITTSDQLQAFCKHLASCKSIAFDTEFVSEHSYRPVLCLVQVLADGQSALLDAMQIEDMTPFWQVLAEPGHETIVHAGRSEVEFSLRAVGKAPSNLFDVQIAAGLVGTDYPAGYGTLISKLLHQSAEKHETRTDWRKRPLSEQQISYALADVHYLPLLRETIYNRLEELDRVDWLQQEVEAWLKNIQHAFFNERWWRVSGNSGLSPRKLAIVRELWRWREAEAERRNCGVRRVLRDDLIVELAKRQTSDLNRISAVRGLERGDLRRRLPELAAAIQHALDLAQEDCPQVVHRDRLPQLPVLGQFLFSALGSIARQAELAPALVGTPSDVRELVAYRTNGHRNKNNEPPALTQGWRAKLVGELFDDLLAGKKAIRITDPLGEHPLSFEPTAPKSTRKD